MSDLSEYLNAHVPDEWSVTHLIFLDPEWQANICNGEHVATGNGDTPENALLVAGSKAEQGLFVGRLASLAAMNKSEASKIEAGGLLAALGLAKPKPPRMKRRM